jgi:hypothetical protein
MSNENARELRGVGHKGNDPCRYRIVPIGSGPVGWAIERDGVIDRTGPSLEVLGAYLDAILVGASVYDAADIAEVIRTRPRPSYEERRAVFKPTGRPEPSRKPFPIISKGGGRPTF